MAEAKYKYQKENRPFEKGLDGLADFKPVPPKKQSEALKGNKQRAKS